MIEAIQLLWNVGTFENVSSGAHLPLNRFALIYAENGRGKTTLSAILRSLGNGDPVPVTERKRLGADHPPHIVIAANGGTVAVFQNDAWTNLVPEMFVFDDHFVAENVHSGMEVAPEHRQNLHDLIIGSEGVALNATLQTHVAQVEEHNKSLQAKASAIPPSIRGRLDIDAFCALENREDIDSATQEAERNLSAARDAGAVHQQKLFDPLTLPSFDLSKVERLLGRSLPDLEADAAARVQAHLAKLTERGETWVAEGMTLIEPASAGQDHQVCPFCAQDLRGSPLIAHYQAYFSEAYANLRNDLDEELQALTTAHTGEAVAAFERSVRTLTQLQQFWSRFADVPGIALDTAAIAVAWKKAYEAVIAPLRLKQSAPLESCVLSNEAKSAVADYEQERVVISDLNAALQAANEKFALVKEKAAAADLPCCSAQTSDRMGHPPRVFGIEPMRSRP